MANILHIHPDYRTAKRFVLPLIDYEKAEGHNSLLIYSNGHGDIFNRKIMYDFTKDNLVGWIYGVFKLFIYIYQTRPDIVFCHNSKAAFFPLIICWVLKIKNRIYFNHGVPFLAYNYIIRYLLKSIEHSNLIFCSNAITVSEQAKDILNSIQSRISVKIISRGSACGIDFNEIENISSKKSNNWRVKNGFKQDDFIIAYIGRAERRKGIRKISELWKLLDSQPKFQLILCGPSEKEVSNENIIKNENIKILGFIDNVFEILNEVDVVISPSYHEGLPYGLIEAMCFGCIVIANNTYGINSLIEDGYNGFLVENNQVIEFHKKLIYIYENKSKLNEIVENARSYVKIFDRKTFLKKYCEFINCLL